MRYLHLQEKWVECAGKSDLTALMMRIAGIPAACVTTIMSETGAKHEYNAIYLKDENNNDRTGWVLLDTDWETLDIDEGCDRKTYKINDTVRAKIKDFCPAFYNDNLSFKSANEKLLRQPIHKINGVFNFEPFDHKFDLFKHNFTINQCNYKMRGIEGKSNIQVDVANMLQDQSVVTIYPDIVNLGMKIKVGSNVRELVLIGDEIIDLSGAENLKSIDAKKSNKYYIEDFKLYDKKTKKPLCVANSSGKIDNVVPYSVCSSFGEMSILVGSDVVCSEKYNVDLTLPEFLTKFKLPIKIGYGVSNLILRGSEIVDLSQASDLKRLDVTNSEIYKKQGDKLVEKSLNRTVIIPDGIKVEIIDNKQEDKIVQDNSDSDDELFDNLIFRLAKEYDLDN